MPTISAQPDFSDAFAQIRRPEVVQKNELDDYLNAGWFRIGQALFTTQFLKFNTTIYNALWLRIDLTAFTPSSTQQKLLKRNSRFKTEISDLKVTPDIEELYQRYKTGIPFETGKSVTSILGIEQDTNIFCSQLVCIYDDQLLIGCGVFDIGHHGAAGIMTFYDPNYKKYSLGHYIILQKLLHCQQQSFHYFFPGYLVPGYKPFEYKRSLGGEHSSYFHFSTGNWLKLTAQKDVLMPFETMQMKLLELHETLEQIQLESEVLRYSYFDVQLMPGFQQPQLFDYPIFLLVKIPLAIEGSFVVVYNVHQNEFNALLCTHIWLTQQVESIPGFYNESLLEILYALLNEPTSTSFVQRLKQLHIPN